jgi:hypothetical protein
VVNATRDPIERISTIIDHSADGWAALDLATRVAQRRNCDLEVLWVPSGDNSNSELVEMLSAVATRVSRINTVLLESQRTAELKQKNLSNLVVIGANLVVPLKFADQLRSLRRCTIVVQGTSARLVSKAIAQLGRQRR